MNVLVFSHFKDDYLQQMSYPYSEETTLLLIEFTKTEEGTLQPVNALSFLSRDERLR